MSRHPEPEHSQLHQSTTPPPTAGTGTGNGGRGGVNGETMKSRRQSISAAGGGEGTTTAHSSGGAGCIKMERKDVEKNRRLHMKGLCLKLSSLIPPAIAVAVAPTHASSLLSPPPPPSCSSNPSKDAATQLDHLDNAAAYIKQLKGRIEALKQRKGSGGVNTVASPSRREEQQGAAAGGGGGGALRMPVIEVRYRDGTLEVVLVSEAGRPFKLHEVITVLEQEGAEVVSAGFSVVGDKIFYTVHSQALSSRIGLDASRVADRLQGLQPPLLDG